MQLPKAWQCGQGCTIFETIAIPHQCPFCGSTELYPQRESLRDFTTYDNDDVPTKFDDE